jgi:hypothetical protein
MSIGETILDQIRAVAEEQNIPLPPLNDSTHLLETGLDSLCFAILVSRLEDITGLDPFSAAQPATFPRTIGELVRLYNQINA